MPSPVTAAVAGLVMRMRPQVPLPGCNHSSCAPLARIPWSQNFLLAAARDELDADLPRLSLDAAPLAWIEQAHLCLTPRFCY